MYALAASAAGVGVMVLAQQAEAKIIYTKTYKHIVANVPFHLDLNHDGVSDFRLLNHASNNGESTWIWLSVHPDQPENGFQGHNASGSGYSYASALRGGSLVRPPFLAGGGMLAAEFEPDSGSWCQKSNKYRYLGLKFEISGRPHYGWAHLDVACVQLGIKAILTGYAYETIPNKPVITGKTRGPDVITVQEGSLGHLARGASEHQVTATERK